jgi:sterol desaturase/sphingolipid hydroxylase (fatty acid hydroxylase superfamily)
METAKPKLKGSGRLFENRFLEGLTRTHIAVPLVIFGVYAIGLLYWSFDKNFLTLGETILVFLLGTLAFTLLEYLMHRFLFHLPPTSERNKKISYKLHGIHHDYPKDKKRLAMPPVVSITLATLFLLLFKLMMGNAAFAFTAGFVLGYAGYLFVHYIVHAYQVPNNMFKVLWVHHGIHHYKRPDKAFGVSSPLWDHIFRTMP